MKLSREENVAVMGEMGDEFVIACMNTKFIWSSSRVESGNNCKRALLRPQDRFSFEVGRGLYTQGIQKAWENIDLAYDPFLLRNARCPELHNERNVRLFFG